MSEFLSANNLPLSAYHNVERVLPEISDVQYNFERQQFERISTVERVPARWFEERSESEAVRRSGAGRSTLARSAIYGSLVRATSEERPGILAEIGRQLQGRLDPALKDSFYSRIKSSGLRQGLPQKIIESQVLPYFRALVEQARSPQRFATSPGAAYATLTA